MQFNWRHLNGMDRRTDLIRKNIIVSFFLKGWDGIVILLMVPLTLHCLGEYNNGVWMTISSMLIWIDNMDIGLGNGLRNKLAQHIAENKIEEAKEVVSSTFGMLILIIIPISIVLLIGVKTTDVYELFNVNKNFISNLGTLLSVCIVLSCSTFIFKFIGNFYLGLQLPAVNNLLVTTGHTLALIGTFILWEMGSHSILLIAIINTCSPLIVYAIAFYVTFNYKYKLFAPSKKSFIWSTASCLIKLGLNFFILQISGVILFMSSNLLLSRLFSPSLVTPYQIVYRYFSVVLIIFTIISVPFWSATTEAYTKKDFQWIRTSRHKMQKIILLILIGMIVMSIISPYVYHIWVGSETKIPMALTVVMAIYIFELIVSMSYSYFLNGIGVLRVQLICTVLAAVIFIPLSIIANDFTHNIICVPSVLILVNLPGLIFNIIQLDKIINHKAHGIWLK